MQADVTSMINATMAAFAQRLAALSWMDDTTRTAAAAKLAAIHPLVGYPSSWEDGDPPFAIGDAHLANILAWRMSAVAANLAGAGQPPVRYPWMMRAYTVNAYYAPADNDIVFPAGILQGAFYSPNAPLAINWGSLGSVIGHEITHGFDTTGSDYDADGALRDWWTPASRAAFAERVACVQAAYEGLPSQGGTVDGLLTLGENIADMGGLATAYAAYQTALATTYNTTRTRKAYERDVRQVFGMEHEALFFASYARLWCTNMSPSQAYARLVSDPHAPGLWRANIPTSQNYAWATAYSCPPPGPNACSVW